MNPYDFVDGYVLITRNGSPYRQHRGEKGMSSDIYSVFGSRSNAEATNASMLKGTGTVFRLARSGLPSKMVAGIRVVDDSGEAVHTSPFHRG